MIAFESFYSMARTPFCRGIPCDQVYRNQSVNDAIGRLRYACVHKQFAVLSGGPGTGKTTILRCVKDSLRSSGYVFVYVSEQHL
ncbi:MAG: hypothetical protein LUD50_00180, partial [Clostridia bacterium]|nr:hypothetical protein [Clostridia bacterium]